MERNTVRNLLIATIIIVLGSIAYLMYSNYQLNKELKITHKVAVDAEDDAYEANNKAERVENDLDDTKSDLDDANSRIDDLESDRE